MAPSWQDWDVLDAQHYNGYFIEIQQSIDVYSTPEELGYEISLNEDDNNERIHASSGWNLNTPHSDLFADAKSVIDALE